MHIKEYDKNIKTQLLYAHQGAWNKVSKKEILDKKEEKL